MPMLYPPSTPEVRGVPSGAVSTVLRQSGAGSFSSNEEANSLSAVGALAGSAVAAPCEPIAKAKAAVITTAGPHLCRALCRMPDPSCAVLDNVVSYMAQEPVARQVASGVKGVACGIRGLCRGFFRQGGHRGLIFPRGLNSDKTIGQPCIRSCSVGGKWTIPVGDSPDPFFHHPHFLHDPA